MSTVLVTGASGFIGRRLVQRLSADGHTVIAMSRKASEGAAHVVAGQFHSFEDLRQLDGFAVDAAVHLAAETGGCTEEAGIAVNVAGTRRLMRYLIDRGCKKIILASSICAAGGLSANEPRFIPLHLPMSAEHRFAGHDAYGLSKWLMEEMARAMASGAQDVDVIALRLGAVTDEAAWDPKPQIAGDLALWGFVALGRVALGDVIDGFARCVQLPVTPGYRQSYVTALDNASDQPVPSLVREFLGDRLGKLDLRHYERDGHAFDGLYDMTSAKALFGIEPRVPMQPAKFKAWKEQR